MNHKKSRVFWVGLATGVAVIMIPSGISVTRQMRRESRETARWNQRADREYPPFGESAHR